jgi:hypothetical protein
LLRASFAVEASAQGPRLMSNRDEASVHDKFGAFLKIWYDNGVEAL